MWLPGQGQEDGDKCLEVGEPGGVREAWKGARPRGNGLDPGGGRRGSGRGQESCD